MWNAYLITEAAIFGIALIAAAVISVRTGAWRGARR
jgi:hypothetical protein